MKLSGGGREKPKKYYRENKEKIKKRERERSRKLDRFEKTEKIRRILDRYYGLKKKRGKKVNNYKDEQINFW